jgi:type II secretion system protein N
MKRTILKAVGYSAFFLFAVLFFMYWTFPMEKVRHWVEQAAAEKLKLDLTIGELDLAGLNGLEAADVVVRFRAKKVGEKSEVGAEEGTATATATGDAAGAGAAADRDEADAAVRKPVWRTVRIDRLEAHVGLWDVLFGSRLELTAELEALGGRIEGLHVRSDEGFARWKFSADKLDGLTLAALPLEEWLGVALKGKASGTLSLELGKDVFTSKATAELKIEDAELPSPKLEQTLYGETQAFVLSDVKLGTVQLDLTLDRKGNIPILGAKSGDKSTVMHLARVELSGGDLEVGLDERSTITFNPGQGFDNAYLNVHGSFQIQPMFFERQVRRGDDTEKPNLFLRTLLQGDRKWRQAERDGVYGFRCVGKPTFKSCTPTAPPVRGRYTPSARKKAVGSGGAEGEEPGTPTAGRPGGADARDSKRPGVRMLGSERGAGDERGSGGFIRDRGSLARPFEDDEAGLPSLPAPPRLVPPEPAEPEEPPAEEEGVPVEEGPEELPVEEGVEEPAPDGEPVEEGALPEDEAPIEEY